MKLTDRAAPQPYHTPWGVLDHPQLSQTGHSLPHPSGAGRNPSLASSRPALASLGAAQGLGPWWPQKGEVEALRHGVGGQAGPRGPTRAPGARSLHPRSSRATRAGDEHSQAQAHPRPAQPSGAHRWIFHLLTECHVKAISLRRASRRSAQHGPGPKGTQETSRGCQPLAYKPSPLPTPASRSLRARRPSGLSTPLLRSPFSPGHVPPWRGPPRRLSDDPVPALPNCGGRIWVWVLQLGPTWRWEGGTHELESRARHRQRKQERSSGGEGGRRRRTQKKGLPQNRKHLLHHTCPQVSSGGRGGGRGSHPSSATIGLMSG